MTTPDDDLIERVAAGQAKFDGHSLRGLSRVQRDRYLQRARLAVEDMREPTPHQCEAALNELSDCTVDEPKAAAWDAIRAYRAMIDAALNPAPAKPDGDA